ncbi:MAG: amino acid ABC transporter permease [Phycisphaerae bacterium]|nr:MAG: amino acid ABC transporter permease [Phycisphaerae bacterium]
MTLRRFISMFVLHVFAPVCLADGSPPVRIGSKAFTESVILSEIAVYLAENEGHEAKHIEGLGGTRLLWEALLTGQIDVYPEYTGTMSEEILAGQIVHGIPALRAKLTEFELKMTDPIGFNNTYVIGMKEKLAAELNIRTISDLRNHPDLSLRFSNEFMKRADGWEALAQRYQLPHRDVRGLEHALAYEALDRGVIQVTDLYATDAKIDKLQLRRLQDDRQHFPQYQAVYVYRADLEKRMPEFVVALHSMEAAIDEAAMTKMNAQVELADLSENRVAADFLAESRGIGVSVREQSVVRDIARYTVEHLNMVAVSLTAAMLVAIPLGIVAARFANVAQPILGVVGVIQTIPSIALLVLLIRPMSYFSDELGYPQAIAALFLYSLLPIVRNTYTGLKGISPKLLESGVALGLPPWVRLWRIELPLASPMILAGIKTAAVINVGFATLGGFIGAGGFGEPIFTGIRLNDHGVILQGAVPAAVLALLVQGLFETAERVIVPKGLRLKIGT